MELWENVKENKNIAAMNHAEGITSFAINLATEAIQLAAMCIKFIDSNNSDK